MNNEKLKLECYIPKERERERKRERIKLIERSREREQIALNKLTLSNTARNLYIYNNN